MINMDKLKYQIDKANEIHQNKYDYSLIKEYKGVMVKYPIRCPDHGVWEVTLDNHNNKSSGCPKCVGKNLSNDDKIKKANEIHQNKYDYSLIKSKIYAKNKQKILCPDHGLFHQTWDNHVNKKHECPLCAVYGRKKIS